VPDRTPASCPPRLFARALALAEQGHNGQLLLLTAATLGLAALIGASLANLLFL